MKQRFHRVLLWASWVPFAVAGAMVMYQKTASQEVYASTATLVVDPTSPALRAGVKGPGREERMAEVRAMEVELLKSARVEMGTLERLSFASKQAPPGGATLEILPQGDSASVIELRCLSSDPGYARDYLNERVTEYLNYRKTRSDDNAGETMGKIIQEMLHLDKEAKKAAQALEQLEQGDPASLREKEEQRLAALVSELRGEVERLTRVPASDFRAGEPGNVESVKARLAVAEQELRQVADKNAAIRKTKSDLDKFTQSHASWKARFIDLETSGLMESPSVSTVQLAMLGVMTAPPVLVPMAKGAAAGSVVGLVLMLLLMAVMGMFRRKERSVSDLP